MQLRQDFPGDAALVLTNIQLNDSGRYRCDVVDGLEDESAMIHLELQGMQNLCSYADTMTSSINKACQSIDR